MSNWGLFFSLVLLCAGFCGAGAETPGQPETNPAADSVPVGAGTDSLRSRFSPASRRETETGQALPSGENTATPQRLEAQIDICATVRVSGETWLDQTHNYVDRKLCQPAVWFDGFFGEDRVLEDVRPTMLINLRNSARWGKGWGMDIIRDYRFQYRLPQLDKRLKKAKLYINFESTADKFTSQPGQPVEPGVDPATGVRKPTVGVRLDAFTSPRSLGSAETGVKVGAPLDPFIRMRYQYTRPVGESHLIRLTETALWRRVEHFTETSQLDVERKITAFTLLRWSNYVTYVDGTAGINWNTGVSLLTQLTPKSAISYDTSMWGVNSPDWLVQNYRVGIKYRRNFYRPWLFWELEPEITWPKDDSGRRRFTNAFMVTLEVQLGR